MKQLMISGGAMALELVKCPHCGFKFRMDIKKLMDDGETDAVRGIFSSKKRKPIRPATVDIVCIKCKKTFEHEV